MTEADIVDAAISSRRSIRAFLDTPVPREDIEQILKVASRAPSGTNTQPWKVIVCTGDTLQKVKDAAVTAFSDGSFGLEQTYKYYPDKFEEPYLSRRRKVGWDLYGLLGIEKGDGDKMFAQHKRNYLFFDAPMGMFFIIDDRMEIGSWLDHGMFMENVMVAARGRGLDTCPQAAWAPYHRAVRDIIGLEETDVLVAGMALGYANEEAIENTLVTERASSEDFVTFLD